MIELEITEISKPFTGVVVTAKYMGQEVEFVRYGPPVLET